MKPKHHRSNKLTYVHVYMYPYVQSIGLQSNQTYSTYNIMEGHLKNSKSTILYYGCTKLSCSIISNLNVSARLHIVQLFHDIFIILLVHVFAGKLKIITLILQTTILIKFFF